MRLTTEIALFVAVLFVSVPRPQANDASIIGAPVSARAIAFTWTLGDDPASGFGNVYVRSRANSVDGVDDHAAPLQRPRTGRRALPNSPGGSFQ